MAEAVASLVVFMVALQLPEKVCGEQALKILRLSQYVCIVDLEWGRGDYLWETIEQGLYNLEPAPFLPPDDKNSYLARQAAAVLEYKNEKESHEGDES